MKTVFGKGIGARDRILQAASELFHKQGVRATSPDEIIQVSGTGKGQFYYYFKSKEGLVHEVLQASLQALRSGTAPINYEIHSWDDLEYCFLCHIALQKKFNMTRGCPIGTVGNEIDEQDELIRQDVGLIFEVMRNRLATFFVKEMATGRLMDHAAPERMADFCIATIQGALLMGKITRSSGPVEAAFHEAFQHLKRYVRQDINYTKAG